MIEEVGESRKKKVKRKERKDQKNNNNNNKWKLGWKARGCLRILAASLPIGVLVARDPLSLVLFFLVSRAPMLWNVAS